MCGSVDGVKEPSIDSMRGELYILRNVAISKSEIDLMVVVRV